MKNKITLDLFEINAKKDLVITDIKADSRIFVFMREGGVSYSVSPDCKAVMMVKKDTDLYQITCSAEGSALVCDIKDLAKGLYSCEIVLTEEENRLTTPRFYMSIEEFADA